MQPIKVPRLNWPCTSSAIIRPHLMSSRKSKPLLINLKIINHHESYQLMDAVRCYEGTRLDICSLPVANCARWIFIVYHTSSHTTTKCEYEIHDFHYLIVADCHPGYCYLYYHVAG